MLVFFDDILIYSKDWPSHLEHLRTVFSLSRQHILFAKASKCSFAQPKVDYLGHVISAEGVTVESGKVEAVKAWPTPVNVKGVRGFLGLTDYYRKFIQNYGSIARPFTALWNSEADAAFS